MKVLKFKLSVILLLLFVLKLNAQVNLTNGLIFHLPLDNHALDVSGNNNNGTAQNTLVTQNRFGSKMKAAKFDGAVTNGIITMGSPLMNNLSDWSISYWFRVDQNFNAMSLVGQDNSIESGYYTNSNRVIVFHPTFGSFSFPISNPSSWNHVVLTGNNQEIKCFLNGSLVRTESGNYSAVATPHAFNIGGNVVNQSNNSWFRGAIDDVRLYNRVLNTQEVNTLFNANSVQINILNISNLTPCAGDTINVNFAATGNVLEGNEFVLELSDINGNYVDNIEIGKIQSDSLNGTISGVIPIGAPSSSNYTLRVSSTNIMSVGNPSSQNISIRGVIGNIPNPNLFRFIGESNGRVYFRSISDANYNTAKNNCLANGGHLANIGSIEDQNLLYSYIGELSAWIGLNDDSNEGFLSWENDFTSTFSKWHPNQPGNSRNIVMRVDNGRWNGLATNQSRDYFLQLEPAGLNVAECFGNEIIFNPGNIQSANYSWIGPNNFNGNLKAPSIANLSSINQGTYSLEISANGCSSSGWSKELSVQSLPANKLIGLLKDSICIGNSTTVYVINSETDHEYTLVDELTLNQIGGAQVGNNDTLFFVTNSITSDSKFLIKVTDLNTSCQKTMNDTLKVISLSLPSSPTVQNSQICNGGIVNLNAAGASIGETYNWYNTSNNLISSDSQGIFFTDSILSTTNYFVTIMNSDGCESTPSTITAEVVNPLAPEIDLVSGLLVHYNFKGNTLDQSGNNINAAIIGGNFSYVEDRFLNVNSALNLNGSTRLDAGNPPQIGALTNQVTIAMWVRQTPSNWGFTTPLLNKWQNNGLFVGLDSYLAAPNQPNENRVRWRVNNGTVVNSNTNVPHNQWHHIVCTYNGSQLRIYQNGVLTGQANHTGTITNTITNLEFGRLANGLGSVFYRGDVDDLRLYNRALSFNEVQTLFNNGSVVFSNSPVCEGEGLQLNSPNFTGATYSWSGPNNFTSSDQNPNITNNADSSIHAGVYSLEITRNSCTSIPQNVEVIIKPTPQITAYFNDTVCGISDAVISVTSNYPNVEFSWFTQASGGNLINNQTSNELLLSSITESESRFVSVTLDGCESERKELVAFYYDEVNTNLILSGNNFICQGADYEFILNNSELDIVYEVFINNDSTGIRLIGGDTNLLFNIPSGLFDLGNNIIQLSASSLGCSPTFISDSLVVEFLEVNIPSIVSNSGVDNICNGQDIVLEVSQTVGVSYQWNTGDTTSSISVNSQGNYFVSLTDSNGCSIQSQPFNVQEINLNKPTINILGSTIICDGETTTLEALNTQNLLWNSLDTTPTINVVNSGDFYVMSSQQDCFIYSDTVSIVLKPKPVIDITASNNNICIGDSVSLTAQGGSNISWNQNVINGEYFYPNITNSYFVTVIDSNNCQNSDSITIFVNSLPTISINSSNTDVCQGDELTLSAVASGTKNWSQGVVDGVPFIPDSTQTFIVEVIDNNFCSNKDSITILVNSLPTISLSATNVNLCQGEETVLTASGNGSISWNQGVVDGVAFAPVQTNTYTAIVLDSNNCQASDSIIVAVNNLPNISLSATSQELCRGDSVSLFASSNGTIIWSGGIQNNQYFTPINSSFYFVEAVDTNSCSKSDSIFIEVFDLPHTSPIIGDTIVDCSSNNELYLVGDNIGSTYFWTVPIGAFITNGQGTNQIAVDFNGNFGIVSVVETSNEGCEGEQIQINVDCNVTSFSHELESIKVIPNPTMTNIVISSNQYLGKEFELEIYDGKGQLVLKSNVVIGSLIDLSFLNQGVYYCVLINDKISHRFKVTKI